MVACLKECFPREKEAAKKVHWMSVELNVLRALRKSALRRIARVASGLSHVGLVRVFNKGGKVTYATSTPGAMCQECASATFEIEADRAFLKGSRNTYVACCRKQKAHAVSEVAKGISRARSASDYRLCL